MIILNVSVFSLTSNNSTFKAGNNRAPVSIGAVGALALTVFESVGTSTHIFGKFFHISTNFHKNGREKCN